MPNTSKYFLNIGILVIFFKIYFLNIDILVTIFLIYFLNIDVLVTIFLIYFLNIDVLVTIFLIYFLNVNILAITYFFYSLNISILLIVFVMHLHKYQHIFTFLFLHTSYGLKRYSHTCYFIFHLIFTYFSFRNILEYAHIEPFYTDHKRLMTS